MACPKWEESFVRIQGVLAILALVGWIFGVVAFVPAEAHSGMWANENNGDAPAFFLSWHTHNFEGGR